MRNTSIRFIDSQNDKTNFFSSIRKEVDEYFRSNKLSKNYNSAMVVKTIVLMALYIFPFLAILLLNPGFLISNLLWVLMGIAMAGIGMCVMHDANHGAYSKNPEVNKWLGYTLNLLGGSIFNWKLQHNVLHHTFTNIAHVDDDIADKAIIKLTPHFQPKWFHRFQFIYAFALYSIMTLYWSTFKDFLQFARYIRDGVNKNSRLNNLMVLLKIIAGKLAYFGILILLPIFIFSVPLSHVVVGFLLMHAVAGVILTVVFQLAHTVEGTAHPLPNDANEIETSWAIHQMNTTVNFAPSNRFLTWYLGGLNYQIEHHLFPNVCHVHYPAISRIVKPICKKYDVPYMETKSFFKALGSHIQALNRFSRLPSLNEAIN
ncbi:MAG: acyl-CoA desaturase [Saprospiraceae bacterium]|nr:acyl-CoA desaturase [Saprospiraceae bacterium]